jgi:hypothetical protein
VVPGCFQKSGVRRNAVCIEASRRLTKRLSLLLQQRNKVTHKDVFKHVTADGVDHCTLAALVYDVNHAGLLLVSFRAFVIETV